MPENSTFRQRRNLRLKISVHEEEKLAAEKAAELEGMSLSRWARDRLFGAETGVSSLMGGLTVGQERSQVVVLLALIANRLDELCCDTSPRETPEGVLDLLRSHRDGIVQALNFLFADHAGDLPDDPRHRPFDELEPVS